MIYAAFRSLRTSYVFLCLCFIPILVNSQSLLFDGTDDHVTVPHQASIENIVNGDFTIEAWVNFNATGTYKTIVAKGGGNDAVNTSYFFSISSNQKIALYLSDGSNAIIRESNTTLSTNTWYHVAVTYDFNTRNVQFYLNGSPDGGHFNSFFSSSQADTQPLFIAQQGWDCACNKFSGSMDEVRIWGLERTSAELALSAQFPPSPLNSPIVYYDFNEGSGTTLNDNPGTDHGTLVNSPTWNSTGYPTPSISPGTSNWVEFDGATDFIQVDNYTDGSTGAATIEAWIRTEEIEFNEKSFIDFNTQGHRFVLSGTTLRLYLSSSSSVSTDFTPYFGEETHIAVSIANGNQKLYINGVHVDTKFRPFSGFSGSLLMGAESSGSEYKGKMTDIRIWNDVRTETEIQTNITSLLTGSEANLRAFYNMSEGSGTTLGDHSVNSFTGIFNEGHPHIATGFEQKSNFNGPKWTTDAAAVFPEFITTNLVSYTEENRTGFITDLSARIGSSGSADVGITYSLSGTDASFFSINSSNGHLSVTTELDFDNPSDADTDNNYEIVVSATAGALVENRIYVVQVTNTDCTIDNEAPAGANSGSGYVSIAPENSLVQTFTPCATGVLHDLTIVADEIPTSGNISINLVTGYSGGLPIVLNLGSVNVTSISWNEAGLPSGATDYSITTDIDLSGLGITLYEGNEYALDLNTPNGRYGRGPNSYPNGTIYHGCCGGVFDINQDLAFTMDIIEAANTAPQFLSASTTDFDEETTGTVLDVDARDEYSSGSGTPEDFNITYSLSGVDAALFDINSTTGVITFITPPDFEIPSDNGGDNVYDITVTANDGLSSMQNIAITVQDTFESVTFTSSSTASVAENATVVTTLTSVGANPAGTLSYSITGGDDQLLFTLSGADLSFTAGPDFEVPGDNGGDNTYEVQVTVDDTFTTDDLLISVSVTDEDEAPVAILLSNNTIAENGAVDDVIGTLSVQNPDAGDTHTYLINGTTENIDFKISGDQLLANRVYNFEAETGADVDITVRDAGGKELTQTFSIDVTDANDAPVAINLSNLSIEENTTVGTLVGTLTTIDFDAGDTHTYSHPAGYESNDLFEIVGDELRTLAAGFDFETDSEHVVRIETNDGNGGIYQQDFTINITDVNENPVFTTNPSQSIEENVSMIATLEATDVDAGSTLTFSISGGDDQSLFNVSGTDLSFITAPNFETPADNNGDNVYEVQVSVSDETNIVDLLVSVAVTDVNEPEPPLTVTEGSQYDFGIDPEVFLGTFGSVSATTIPSWLTLSPPQPQLLETLTGSEASSYQSVESTVVGEDGRSYLLFVGGLTVIVVDPQGADVVVNLSGFDPFTVHPRRIAVDPAGNMYISDNDRIVKVELDETHTVVTSSLTNAKDIAWHPDGFLIVLDDTSIKKVETDGTITNLVTGLSTNTKAVSVSSEGDMFYAETGNFDPMNVEETIHQFQLDGTVGSNLFSPDFLDFEESTYDMIDIVADSQGRVYAHFWWTDALANIFDRIELIATTGANSELVSHSIDINSEKFISISVGADDELFYIDADLSSTITYIRSFSNSWLLSGTPGTSDVGSHNVALTIDNGVDPLDLSFTINVDYLNDDPSDIALSPASIDEGLPVGSLVGTLTPTDSDIVHGDSHTFALVTGTGDDDNAQFTISGNELLSNAIFDDEIQGIYSVRVEATDSRGGFFSKALTIHIQGINSAPTNISLSNDNIDEGAVVGSIIGALSTTDANIGDSHTYSLVSGFGDNADFEISGSDLINSTVFNFESKASYSIKVLTDDGNGGAFEKEFTINVNDVNDAPTALGLTNNSVDENTIVGSTIGSLSTTDEDAGDSHTYSLVSGFGDNADFEISGSDLINSTVFNFESKAIYNIKILADDGNGGTFEEEFTINVNDVNDDPTAIVLSGNSIFENTAAGTNIGAFTTTDEDINSIHTYSLVSGFGDNANFNLSGAQLTNASVFDFETKASYSIKIETNDGNGGTFEQEFEITVKNANDSPTAIALSNNNIDEDAVVGSVIGTLSTVDPDVTDTHTYEVLTSFTFEGMTGFPIQANGSDLVTTVPMNFEIFSSFTIDVKTTDASGFSFTETFTILINDVNEAPTALELSNDKIPEESPLNTVIGTLSTVDEDLNDSHTYEVLTSFDINGQQFFPIEAEGSNLVTKVVFDFESGVPEFTIDVKTTDQGGLSFTESITIRFTDANDAPTEITLSSNIIAENEAVGTIIGSLEAIDVDAGDTHTFSLVSGFGDNSSFNITGASLTSAEMFDFETQSSYSIKVLVDDGNGGTFEEEFTIEILDIQEGDPQTITFDALADRVFGGDPFELVATASSGLSVSYTSSNSSVATISGNTVTIIGTGETVITASQEGGSGFEAAADVSQVLTVNKATQTITFDQIPDQVTGASAITLSATASSGLTIDYSVTGPASLSANILTITGVGEVQVTASQAGNENYLAASFTRAFVVTDPAKTDQTITFDPPSTVYVNETPVILEASSDSGLEITFEIISGSDFANLSGDNLHLVAPGSIEVVAKQNGDATFNPALATATIEIKPVFTVSGTITDELGNAFSAGTVAILDPITNEGATATPDASGNYSLANLKDGSYYLAVFPNNTDDYYTTFLGDKLFWQDATVVNLNSDLNSQNIQMIPQPSDELLTGNGVVTGRVIEDDGTGGRIEQGRILAGTAIPDVSVFLIRLSDDQIMTEVKSDENGDFEITGIPEGEYRLQVEVTGVAMDLAGSAISIDAEGTPVVLTAMVGENGIVIEVEPPLGFEDEFEYSIYPNPAQDFIQVEIKGEVNARIYTLEGKEVISENFIGEASLDLRSLGAGMYLLDLLQDGKKATVRFIRHN